MLRFANDRAPRTGIANMSSRCRSTCPRRSTSATGPVLRRHRRGPGHGRHPLVPGGRGGRHGAAGQPGCAGAGGRTGTGPKLFPAAGHAGGRAGAVRRYRGVPGVDPTPPGHVRGRRWIDNPRWGTCRSTCVPAAAGRVEAAGQPDFARAAGRAAAPAHGDVLSFSLAGDGEIVLLGGKKARARVGLRRRRVSLLLAGLHGADPCPRTCG